MLALLALAACHGGGNQGDADVQAVVGVKTALVTRQPFTETVTAIGTVQPRAGHVASLAAPAATRVSRVYVTSGQHVTRGEPLVELEQAGFDAAARSAEAAVAVAQANYARQQRLSGEGIIARKDVEQASADLARARADLVAAQRASELSVLRAPISGVVTHMSAVLGASVDANQALVDIADPSALDIMLEVTPTSAARVHPGQTVTLSAGQSAGGEALGIGTVIDVAGTVDTLSRTVAVRVRAPSTRRPLRIGETIFGSIAVAVHPRAITVPAESLVPEGESFKVFVVDASGIAHAQPVTVGARTDSLVEITSGLAGGERVVTYGAYGVSDSAKVVPLGDTAAHPAAPGTKP